MGCLNGDVQCSNFGTLFKCTARPGESYRKGRSPCSYERGARVRSTDVSLRHSGSLGVKTPTLPRSLWRRVLETRPPAVGRRGETVQRRSQEQQYTVTPVATHVLRLPLRRLSRLGAVLDLHPASTGQGMTISLLMPRIGRLVSGTVDSALQLVLVSQQAPEPFLQAMAKHLARSACIKQKNG